MQYLGGGEEQEDSEYTELAEEYHNDIDFAFFFVNFHTSKTEYLELTKREKYFIRKAWEDKLVQDSTILRNAVLNAVTNAMRKKSQKFQELWTKIQQPLDKEVAKEQLSIITEVEQEEGKSWVDLIYQANNLSRPREVE